MSHTAYWITPTMLRYICFSKIRLTKEKMRSLWDLFENHKAHIRQNMAKTYLQFKQSVMNLLNIYELDAVSCDEAALILMETEHTSFILRRIRLF